jgi:myo-inositol-1(or 4)-monophosphatase
MLGEEDGNHAGLERQGAAVGRRSDRRHRELRAPAAAVVHLDRALTRTARPLLGVIHNPMTDELHAAANGRGATLNGTPIRASAVDSPKHARINLGFSYRRDPRLHVASIERLLARECEYSRLGSGALGMAYVADGRFEGYFEPHINAWDVTAGIVIVREAGGFTNDFFAGERRLERGNAILAGAPGMRAFLEDTLGDLMDG